MGRLLDLLGSGWKTYIAGVLLIAGSAGLAADFAAQLIGLDVFTDKVTTWDQVVGMFAAGMAIIGIRHKQDVTQKVVTASQEDIVETQEEIIHEVSGLPHKKGST